MSKIQANILRDGDTASLTVTVEGDPRSPYLARDDHPNFKQMVAAIVSDPEALPSLFDVAETMAVEFQRLSERVTVESGRVKFDGVVLNATITQHILDAVTEGADESTYVALVNFLEKVQTNPDENSRTQLYDWIKAQDGLTITESGDMVGYKYVTTDPEFGYRSSASGREPVRVTWGDRSEVFTGRIPNPLGGLIEMPRDLVDADPTRTCSVGLHIGAWNYVSGSNTILEVHVNPRDVVAVPTDYNGEKVRACRYTVVGPITQKYGQAVKREGEEPKPDVRNGEAPIKDRADLDLTLEPLRGAQAPRYEEGDRVRFVAFENDTEWERPHGGEVGKIFVVGSSDYATSSILLRHENGDFAFYTTPKQIEPVKVYADGFTDGDKVRIIDERTGETLGDAVGVVGPLDPRHDGDVRWRDDSKYVPVTFKTQTWSTGRWEPERLRKVDQPEFAEGDRIVDWAGDQGTVVTDGKTLVCQYDNPRFGRPEVHKDSYTVTDRSGRTHGKGGATSHTAKGRGLNPAQDPKTGQFVNGRPGSKRDPRTGRFGA